MWWTLNTDLQQRWGLLKWTNVWCSNTTQMDKQHHSTTLCYGSLRTLWKSVVWPEHSIRGSLSLSSTWIRFFCAHSLFREVFGEMWSCQMYPLRAGSYFKEEKRENPSERRQESVWEWTPSNLPSALLPFLLTPIHTCPPTDFPWASGWLCEFSQVAPLSMKLLFIYTNV